MSPQKIDIFKLHKSEYKAGVKPSIVETSRAMYLTVSGKGSPGEDSFQSAVKALYAMAYTIKMGRKADGKGDYTIGKLEGVYWMDNGANLSPSNMKDWHWNLLIRTPEVVDGFPISTDDLDTARKRLREQGKDNGTGGIEFSYLEEGPCVQMLHVGPYETEQHTLAIMLEFCESGGYRPHGHHHEIYLSDPRRVAPEKLKTILRMAIHP